MTSTNRSGLSESRDDHPLRLLRALLATPNCFQLANAQDALSTLRASTVNSVFKPETDWKTWVRCWSDSVMWGGSGIRFLASSHLARLPSRAAGCKLDPTPDTVRLAMTAVGAFPSLQVRCRETKQSRSTCIRCRISWHVHQAQVEALRLCGFNQWLRGRCVTVQFYSVGRRALLATKERKMAPRSLIRVQYTVKHESSPDIVRVEVTDGTGILAANEIAVEGADAS